MKPKALGPEGAEGAATPNPPPAPTSDEPNTADEADAEDGPLINPNALGASAGLRDASYVGAAGAKISSMSPSLGSAPFTRGNMS
mmetsp:Transcript_58894/g.170875  ORF Transcript_58894/g.170875 Transcript_58894/m.170875 type:complete len:85 (+) Transcript_58894:292-546(+)